MTVITLLYPPRTSQVPGPFAQVQTSGSGLELHQHHLRCAGVWLVYLWSGAGEWMGYDSFSFFSFLFMIFGWMICTHTHLYRMNGFVHGDDMASKIICLRRRNFLFWLRFCTWVKNHQLYSRGKDSVSRKTPKNGTFLKTNMFAPQKRILGRRSFPFRKASWQGLPSRKLTYPPKMAFWRWFSFSQGGIC